MVLVWFWFGFMKAKKLPSGSWRIQVQINKKRYSVTAKTKKEVERKATELILSRLDAPRIQLGVLVDNFIANRSSVLSPASVERYRRIRKTYFGDIMDTPADYLTNERLQAAVNRMSERYSPKTVRTAWGLISSTLKANGITARVTLPKKERLSYNVPTEADVFNLIDSASGNLKTAIMLAAFCGLRRGEIVALESSDIQGQTIHVSRCAVYDDAGALVFKRPKTYHSDRYIKAPDAVLGVLNGKAGRVCPVVPSAITSEFIQLRNRLGLNCRFHDLRHFFASWLHSLNIPDQYILERGGWKTDSTLKAVYRNTLKDVDRAADDLINARINAHKTHTDSQQSP